MCVCTSECERIPVVSVWGCVGVCMYTRRFSAVLRDFLPLIGILTPNGLVVRLESFLSASVCLQWWGAVVDCGSWWCVWACIVRPSLVRGGGAGAVGPRLGAWGTLAWVHRHGGVPAHPCTCAPVYAQTPKPVHAYACGRTPVCVWVRSGARAPASL